jgi:hypothetical protein
MRKVTLEVKMLVQVHLEDGVSIADAMHQIDYDFSVSPEHGDVINTEILDYELTDSK